MKICQGMLLIYCANMVVSREIVDHLRTSGAYSWRRFLITVLSIMRDELIQRLDTTLPELGPAAPPPTAESIDKISKHFGIVLPDDLVDLAMRSKKFSSLFLSLGPDYPSRNHIIRVNSDWRHRRRTRRLPNHLVIMTHGFMDDRFWCMDIQQPNAIQFWCPEPITYASVEPPPNRYATFEAFIEGLVMGSDDQ